MNTLRQLNEWGATSIDAPDARPSNLILDRTPPDVVLNITSTAVSVTLPFNIVEIINYTAADVQLQISIRALSDPALTGASVTWPSLPSGINLNIDNGVSTIDNITTPAQWFSLKNFTWNLPADYASKSLWFIDAALLYTINGEQRQYSWAIFDPRFYYVSRMTASSTLVADNTRVKLNQAALASRSRLVEGAIPFDADFAVTSTMTVDGFLPIIARLEATSSVVARLNGTIQRAATIVATSSINATLTVIVDNLIDRQYNTNTSTLIFTTNNTIFQIADPNPAVSGTFAITLTVDFTGADSGISDSEFVAPVKTFTFSGTINEVNTKLTQIRVFPEYNRTASATLNYQQRKNNVLQVNKTIALTRNINNPSFTSNLYTFTSSGPFQFKFSDYAYTNYNILLVGGGGGASMGYGGGGGEAKLLTNLVPNFVSTTITVGQGGIGGLYAGPSTPALPYATNGGFTNATGLNATATANPGTAARTSPGVSGTGFGTISGGNGGGGTLGLGQATAGGAARTVTIGQTTGTYGGGGKFDTSLDRFTPTPAPPANTGRGGDGRGFIDNFSDSTNFQRGDGASGIVIIYTYPK